LTGDLARNVIVSGGSKGDIKWWDMKAGRDTKTLLRSASLLGTHTAESQVELRGHVGAVLSISLGPRFRFVVTTSADGTIKMWDTESTKCLRSIDAGSDEFGGGDRYGGVMVTDITVQPMASPVAFA